MWVRNCVLRHSIEVKIGAMIRRIGRRKTLFDDLERKRYWNLKKRRSTRSHSVWRTRFGRGRELPQDDTMVE